MTISHKPMMVISKTETCGNALCFATYEEALASARDLWSRWAVPIDFTVHGSDDPVNYRWDDKEGNVRL